MAGDLDLEAADEHFQHARCYECESYGDALVAEVRRLRLERDTAVGELRHRQDRLLEEEAKVRRLSERLDAIENSRIGY
jgi:hypothetical protein